MKICDVCHRRKSVGVACSTTGAVSFAYCAECAASGREPYGAVVASLYGMSSLDDVATWYHRSIYATLEAEGKTVEELFTDVAAFEREFDDATQQVRMQVEIPIEEPRHMAIIDVTVAADECVAAYLASQG